MCKLVQLISLGVNLFSIHLASSRLRRPLFTRRYISERLGRHTISKEAMRDFWFEGRCVFSLKTQNRQVVPYASSTTCLFQNTNL